MSSEWNMVVSELGDADPYIPPPILTEHGKATFFHEHTENHVLDCLSKWLKHLR